MTPLPVLAAIAALALPPADTLVIGTLADPLTLFPHRATDLVSQAVVVNTNDTLVRQGSEAGRAEAALATTWATPDHRTWTFTLRQGVRFHDGVPFDADAVVLNFESLRKHRAFPGAAERLGPLVVRVALERPNAALLSTLSQPYYAMQSPGALRSEKAGAVGTGPFRVATSRAGLVELVAAPEHWGGAPRLRRIVFRHYPREDALVEALLTGEVDLTSALGPGWLPKLRVKAGLSLDSATGLNVAFLSINNERPPWSDPRVRQAVSRAIDRTALVVRFLGGHGEPARGPLPPALRAPSSALRDLGLDRTAAQRLLAEAGFPEGVRGVLLTVDAPRPYMPTPLELAAALRDQLAAAGIRLTLRLAPSWTEYLDLATRGDYELALLGWQADSTNPDDSLSALLSATTIGSTNRSRYRSSVMDALLKRARRESEPDDREAVYRETEQLFLKDMPFVPLFHVSVFTAYRTMVRGIVPGPTGLLRYDKTWKLE